MNKKKLGAWLLCALLAASLTACSSSSSEEGSQEAEENPEVSSEEAEEGAAGEEEEAEEYDPFDYVELGAYTGFEVDKVLTEVTDDDIEEEIEIEMEDNSTEVDVTDGAEDEDYLNIDYQFTIDGENPDSIKIWGEEIEGGGETGREITVGYYELGEEMEEKLPGMKAGDERTETITLDGDTFGSEMDGVEAEITMSVNRVYRYELPELTDAYVQEYTEYDSVEEYRAGVKESLEASTEATNLYDAGELALGMAVEEAVFYGYPDSLYQSIYDEWADLYDYYADMFGMDREEMIEDEELEEIAEEETCIQLVIDALVIQEDLALTEDEYEEYLEGSLEDYGVDTVEELYEYYSESEMRDEGQRSKVANFILENSTIVEISEDEYDEKYYGDDEYDEDDEEYDEEEYDEEFEDEEEEDEDEEDGEYGDEEVDPDEYAAHEEGDE